MSNPTPSAPLAPVPIAIGGEVIDVPRITNFYRYKRCSEAVNALMAAYAAARDPERDEVDFDKVDIDRVGALNLVVLSAALFEVRPELTVIELEKRMSAPEVRALIAPAWALVAHNFASGAEAA